MNSKSAILLTRAIAAHQAGALDDAKNAYEKLLKIDSRNIVALKNLALIYTAGKDSIGARNLYNRSIQIAPQDPILLNNFANFLRREKDYEAAKKVFLSAILCAPKAMNIRANYALLLIDLEDLEAANEQVERALEFNSDIFEILVLHGKISALRGDRGKAVNCFSKALLQKQNATDVLALRGTAYLELGELNLAKADFETILSYDSNNEDAKYALASMRGDASFVSAPDSYVKKLFDSYAEKFENHLINSLNYRTPTVLREQFNRFCTSDKGLSAVDLGCGTGLSGLAFRDVCKKIDGVDLSEEMLKEAKKKDIYDDLFCMDVVSFLSGKNDAYDLVICADVFIYIGDLTSVFKHLALATKIHGWVSLSIEETSVADFQLQPSRRYSHSIDYIHRLAKDFNFNVIASERRPIRKELGKDIEGFHILLQKT